MMTLRVYPAEGFLGTWRAQAEQFWTFVTFTAAVHESGSGSFFGGYVLPAKYALAEKCA
ncbi:MAG: hypothetical protein ACC628_03270 [Pirellulaceae bacterium]